MPLCLVNQRLREKKTILCNILEYLGGTLPAHHLLMEVVPPFGNAEENDAQDDVADVGKEVIEIGEIPDEVVRIGTCKVVIAQILIPRSGHHLLERKIKYRLYKIYDLDRTSLYTSLWFHTS